MLRRLCGTAMLVISTGVIGLVALWAIGSWSLTLCACLISEVARAEVWGLLQALLNVAQLHLDVLLFAYSQQLALVVGRRNLPSYSDAGDGCCSSSSCDSWDCCTSWGWHLPTRWHAVRSMIDVDLLINQHLHITHFVIPSNFWEELANGKRNIFFFKRVGAPMSCIHATMINNILNHLVD